MSNSCEIYITLYTIWPGHGAPWRSVPVWTSPGNARCSWPPSWLSEPPAAGFLPAAGSPAPRSSSSEHSGPTLCDWSPAASPWTSERERMFTVTRSCWACEIFIQSNDAAGGACDGQTFQAVRDWQARVHKSLQLSLQCETHTLPKAFTR